MTHPLAERLCRHAATIVDPTTRAQLFRSIVGPTSDEELRDAVDALASRAAAGETSARVALMSLQVALSAMPARQRAALELNPALDAQGPGDDEPAAPDDKRMVPDYGRGRPLTLGERKSLARKPDRRMFDRVLRDPHPDVITLLLQNPRLTEPDVVRVCSRRPGTPEVLQRVFASPRWTLRPAVRRALAMNPATPPLVVSALLPLLAPEDLRSILDDDRTPPLVRLRCDELLARAPDES